MNRILVTALVVVVAASWAFTLLLKDGTTAVTADFFAPVPTAVTALSAAIFLFDRWLWRLVGFAFHRPFLSGTWRGTLTSDWEDPKSHQRAGERRVVAVITQTWSSIVFRLYTEESGSVTTAAALVAAPDGKVALTGVYLNTPRQVVRDRSQGHLGGLNLAVDGSVLHGEYFTSRKTTGELRLERIARKRVDSFEQGASMKNPEPRSK